ncbi:MAG: hypothetical protein ACRDPV_05370 [Gaiellaceae bacterium]
MAPPDSIDDAALANPDGRRPLIQAPSSNKLAPTGLAAAVVISVLVVGCGAPSATVGEPFADSGSTPRSSVAAPSRAARNLLRGFLAARVAGKGAQKYLSVPEKAIPLLYATTSGAPYKRAEFNRVRGIEWPYGLTAFRVRLFAGGTVVEQLFFMRPDGRPRLEYQRNGFTTDIAPTTEDGQAVAVPYDLAAGEVTLKVAHPWVSFGRSGFDDLPIQLIPAGAGPTTDGGQRNDWDGLELSADPTLFGRCWQTGPRPVDARALAKSIRSQPDLRATAPVAVSTKRAKALMLDVTIAAGASVRYRENGGNGLLSSLVDPNRGGSSDGKGHATGHASGERMRLYLFDAPKTSSIRVLAIAIVAPKSRFKSVVKAAARVVDSVEFRVR